MSRITSKTAAQYISGFLSDQNSTSSGSVVYAKVAAKKYVQENDKDKSGDLSKDEVSISQEAFDRLDADKNKAISETEMQAELADNEDFLENYLTKGNMTIAKNTMLRSLVKYI